MIRRTLARLARMDGAEVAWRGMAAARILFDRARARVAEPRWSRTSLIDSLALLPELGTARDALAAHRWDDAQRALARHFAHAPRRFAIAADSRPALTARIRREFPDAAADAVDRADLIVSGRYDLLGFRGLRFGDAPLPDWHRDPVNQKTAPMRFWSMVPFLDPATGDHKIIWELNRHQHFLTLGRAYWLTGDRRYRDRFCAELASWLDANPPLTGVNWASMLELAFRSLSWIWALHLFVEDDAQSVRSPARPSACDRSPWLVDLLAGLDRQLSHLEQNLSHYFSPNTHLIGEALALYVAGAALPELAASGRRVATGRRLLLQEIDRQIASDGGHRERSTHYHRYTLDFYALALIIARVTADPAAAEFEAALARLSAAARLLADDNGRVPHFGDDDGGALTPIVWRDTDDLRGSLSVAAALLGDSGLQIGEASEEVMWLAGPEHRKPSALSPQPCSSSLPETGYYVSRSRDTHIVIDGGPHGYQNAGHAHADALSLTLSVRGVPLLIDPGTACYTADAAMRDRMRSTALHNTLILDERSQSIPSGPFHWSHVANGTARDWQAAGRFDYFDGSHDGYAPIEHRRRVLSLHDDLIVVADFIDGSGAHAAAVHWHIDPRWDVETRARGAVFTRPGAAGDRVGLSVPQAIVGGFCGDADSGLGWCSPVYGRVVRTTTVRLSQAGTAPFWMVSVFDLDRDNPVADVDWVPVWADAGALAHAAAVRISRTSSVDHVLFAQPGGGQGRWRVGDVDTDARMLCYRASSDQSLTVLAAVGATTARTKNVELLNPEPVPKASPCAALQVS